MKNPISIRDSSNPVTLAHEMVARDEQQIGIFFASFAIQYLLHKDLLQVEFIEPKFLNLFHEIEITASQRVFIKNLISTRKFVKVLEELRSFFLEYKMEFLENRIEKQPYYLFLSKINKSFLIRQIFKHSEPVLEKFQFLDDYMKKDIHELDFNELYGKIYNFSIEQQILILARLFSNMDDEYIQKRKTILNSFDENIQRTKDEMKRNRERYSIKEFNNIVLFEHFINHYKK